MTEKVHALMLIERDGEEIEVHVSGAAYPFRRGTKSHPMDRFAEPDEPAEIADIAAETKDGEIELTESTKDGGRKAMGGTGRPMTATELLDSLWQTAYRNKDEAAMGYLAQLRGPLTELQADKARIDWLERLDPDSREWFRISDAVFIRKAIDAAMNTNQ